MPSALLSHHSTAAYTLPPLPPPRELAPTERDRVLAPGRGAGNDTVVDWLRTSATGDHRPAPSPRKMSGTHVNGNPLLAANMAGLPYKSVPALRQNARPSQTSLGTVATVQYTSKAPPAHDLQKPPARPRSPTAHREGGRGRDAGRGGGAENHSIAAYLQIPPTINNSKGSLADFAAQVRRVGRTCANPD